MSEYLTEGQNKMLNELVNAEIVDYHYATNPTDTSGGEYFVYTSVQLNGISDTHRVKKQKFIEHLSELHATVLPYAEEVRRKHAKAYR